MACTGQHTIPTNRTATFAVKRFSSADGARLSSSPWTAGPPSPQDGCPTGRDGSAQLGDHYFDPLCGLICLPVWAAPDGRSTVERRRDAGVQYSEARNQISRLCALRRFVLEKLGLEVEGGPMTPHMRGACVSTLLGYVSGFLFSSGKERQNSVVFGPWAACVRGMRDGECYVHCDPPRHLVPLAGSTARTQKAIM